MIQFVLSLGMITHLFIWNCSYECTVKSRRLTAPLVANLAYATARSIYFLQIGEIGDDFSAAAAKSLFCHLSCSSSPLVKFLCLIPAIVAMAAREAFKINRVLNPFVYPFSKMIVTVDGGIPSVEGKLARIDC